MHHSSHVPNSHTNQLTLIALMTAVLCVLGPLAIALPVSPIPISLCTLGIYFAAIVLGTKSCTISVLLYLLSGFAGLPVFTGFTGGPVKVLGPTGGYLLGYIFMALVCGFSAKKCKNNLLLRLLGMGLGTGICYLFGTLWLAYQLSLSPKEALVIGVLPYLAGDFLKLILANTAGITLRKHLKKARLIP